MNTNKLVRAALMTAIVVALTLIVLPVPVTNGYINLGDAGVYAAVGAVGGWWGVAAAAVGSALTDLILGYTIYVPATFLIKGLAALFVMVMLKRVKGFWRLLMLLASGCIIAGGYLLYETLFVCDSFAAALVNLPFNLLQGLVGAALGAVILQLIQRMHLNEEK